MSICTHKGIGVAMKDGNVMMQNSSGAAKELAKKINKALMGNANRVSQWVKYCCCLYAQFNFLRFIHKKNTASHM